MGQQPHIVLWFDEATKPERRDAQAAGRNAVQSASTRLRSQVLDLDEADAGDLIRSGRGIAAEVMPVALVKPTTKMGDEALANGKPNWGLEAVGCLDTALTGAGCRIAILDTGIKRDHAAFVNVDMEVQDFTGVGVEDRHGHGTHCAGTAFGQDVEGTRNGVAPGIEKALIAKVLDDDGHGSSAQVINGLQWAASKGAHVIGCSIGIEFDRYFRSLHSRGLPERFALAKALQEYERTLRLFDAIAQASKAGALGVAGFHVFAAGNASERNEGEDYVAGSCAPGRCFGMSVGAVERDGDTYRLADFSNGPPDLVAPGVGILSADFEGGLTVMDGTSMACPHVAGIAALWSEKLLNEDGEVRPGTIASKITAGAQRENFAGLGKHPTRLVGTGMVQAPR